MISRIAASCRWSLMLQHQLENLRLNGHVQRGGRLVGDQQRRIAGQRHGDHHALPHAAGKLVRIIVHARRRIGNADQFQHLDGALERFLLRYALVRQDGLHHLHADGEDRIQRGHRLLKDHADLFAADRADFVPGKLQQVAALEEDRAVDDLSRAGRESAAGCSAR